MTIDRAVTDNALVFSIALNGYAWAWRSCLRSHAAYAARWGFDYVCVDLPWTVSAAEAAWLKLPLIIRALDAGPYAWVLFLDADALARSHCPDFRCVASAGHDVYMAHGHSGRVNSGVMMVRRSAASVRFYRDIVADCDGAVAPEDAAAYENGHVIKHAKANPLVGLVERRWNNTAEPSLDDYIRHFTGPMAVQAARVRKTLKPLRRLGALRSRILALRTPALPEGPLRSRVERMADAAAARYGVFG